ncbi:MAG: hypothetical protein JO030_08060 [Candidatus Eremiobacteraeota bacterium]|nr:hypothetical protein [Candidatus Eremiobacteraeota bacterium]
MIRTTAGLLALTVIAGCASRSPAPDNWHPVAGDSNTWSIGTGTSLQQYRLTATPFDGGLHDLASEVALQTLTGHPGARLEGSEPFGPCPGEAGIASFRLPGGRRLEEAFSVHDGKAVRVAYSRPAASRSDPGADDAMRRTLCTL